MMGSRKRLKITNSGSVPIQPGGVWIQPGQSQVFDAEQLPPEWRAAGVPVSDIADAKVPALITPGNSAVEMSTSPLDGGIGNLQLGGSDDDAASAVVRSLALSRSGWLDVTKRGVPTDGSDASDALDELIDDIKRGVLSARRFFFRGLGSIM